MKKVLIGLMLAAVMIVGLVGCTTTTWDQGKANSAAQLLGAATVTAYNAQGDKLTPIQKQGASAAIVILSQLGAGADVPIQDQINKAIADKIKDPAIAAQASALSASFLATVKPMLDDAAANGSTGAALQVFVAYCKGLASVPVVSATK